MALNAAGLASAGDGIQILERDGFRRASTQGVLAFGLPTYGEIGADAVDPADFEPCAPPAEPDKPTATLSASTVAPGGTLTVSGTGFTPGEPVVATLHSTPIELGTVTADADGVATLTFTVPADLEPGDHRVELVGQRSGVVVSVAFEVLGVDVPGAPPGHRPDDGHPSRHRGGAARARRDPRRAGPPSTGGLRLMRRSVSTALAASCWPPARSSPLPHRRRRPRRPPARRAPASRWSSTSASWAAACRSVA